MNQKVDSTDREGDEYRNERSVILTEEDKEGRAMVMTVVCFGVK